MQTQTANYAEEVDVAAEAALVAPQNDMFRRTITQLRKDPNAPEGRIVMTRGVSTQSPEFLRELLRSVIAFDAFDDDCDPHRWHEMGVVEVAGETVWFKIDLYDEAYEFGSPAPADPSRTRRVLTLLFPSEY